MPTLLPDSVRESWGEQAAEDFSSWLDDYVQEHAVRRDERPDREGGSTPGVYREVLSRLDVIEERFKQVDQRFEQVDQRFEQVDERFDQLDERLNRMGERFEHRFEQINQRLDEQIAQMDRRLDDQGTQFNDRIDRLHEQSRVMMRWTVGTIAMFGTIVTALLAIAEFGG